MDNGIDQKIDDLYSNNHIVVDYRRQLIEFRPKMWHLQVMFPEKQALPPVLKLYFWKKTLNKIEWLAIFLSNVDNRAKLLLFPANTEEYKLMMVITQKKFPFEKFVKDLDIKTTIKKEMHEPGFIFQTQQKMKIFDQDLFFERFVSRQLCEIKFSGIDEKMRVVKNLDASLLGDIEIHEGMFN